MTPNERVGAIVLTLAFGMLLAVALISIAKASTRHVISIGPAGADPAVCVIDRNDSVAFRNDTDERIWLYLPWGSVVGHYQFVLVVEPGETSKAVEWNLGNAGGDWLLNGDIIATVRTTDDPPPGSCEQSGVGWRLVIGGIAGG